MEYYIAIKRNKSLTHSKTWMNLKSIHSIKYKKPDTKNYVNNCHLYDLLEKSNLNRQKTDQWLPGTEDVERENFDFDYKM